MSKGLQRLSKMMDMGAPAPAKQRDRLPNNRHVTPGGTGPLWVSTKESNGQPTKVQYFANAANQDEANALILGAAAGHDTRDFGTQWNMSDAVPCPQPEPANQQRKLSNVYRLRVQVYESGRLFKVAVFGVDMGFQSLETQLAATMASSRDQAAEHAGVLVHQVGESLRSLGFSIELVQS